MGFDRQIRYSFCPKGAEVLPAQGIALGDGRTMRQLRRPNGPIVLLDPTQGNRWPVGPAQSLFGVTNPQGVALG
jgi:hypothetical protein